MKDMRYILLIAIIGYGVYLKQQNRILEVENERVLSNYKTALHIDSLKVAIYKVSKQEEFEELLYEKKELSSLVSKSKIEKKRIQKLYYQQQKYVDSIRKKMDVSELLTSIRKSVPAIAKWEDKNECLIVKGTVNYVNDSLSVHVTERVFNNNTILIKHEGRRKPWKWLFGIRLGKREISFTPETKCGNNKITIIEKNN